MSCEVWTCHAYRCDAVDADGSPCSVLSTPSEDGLIAARRLAEGAGWRLGQIIRGGLSIGEHFCPAHA